MSEIYELDLDWDFANHLADPESFAVIRAEGVSQDLIVDEYIREVYRYQLEHHREHGQPATASALEATFDDLAISDPLTVVGDIVQRLHERYVKNNGREEVKALAEVYKEDPLALSEAMMEAGRKLMNLTRRRGDSWGTGDHERSMLEYHKMVAAGPGASILGYPEIDTYFHGQRGVTFVLGPPKGMKTWQGLHGVWQNIKDGKTVWAYALELPAYEMNMRLRCLAADIPWWKFLKGKLEREDMALLAEVGELLDELGTFRIISPPVGKRDTKTLVQQAIDGGADVLYIDQLQYLQDSRGHRLGDANDPGAYWGVGDDLREYSKQIPITVIHQFNRSVMNSDEMPVMQQAKGGSMIEEVGTLVLGLWANKDMRHSNVMQIGTLATRNYGLATWELKVNMQRGCGFEVIGKVED